MDGPIVDKVVDKLHGTPELVLVSVAGIFMDDSPNDNVGLGEKGVGRG